jgi:uncharacterized protein YbjT (DUF2867 family)
MTSSPQTPATSPILVTGGTGTLGRLVVARLLDAGHPVRVLSRQPAAAGDDRPGVELVAGDLDSDQGIDAAVAGVDVIVNLAGTSKGDGDKARSLVRAAGLAGAPHVVHISVVGADRVPVASAVDRAMFGYFASKLEAEREIAGSGLPWTTLRATQFHELVLKVAEGMTRLPVIPVPSGIRFQPVAAAEVADRLVELALGAPAGLVPDLAGPEIRGLGDLVRTYLRWRGKRRPFVPMPVFGGAARAVRDGAILAPDRAVGRQTWDEFLAPRRH